MSENHTYRGYIGTYTKGDSVGIYSFVLDTVNEKISEVKPVAALDNPTYLNLTQDNQTLYSVIKKGESGGVAAFSVNEQSGEINAINQQLLEGSSPCHVSVDNENRHVVAANYHKGTVESYLINQNDGTLSQAISVIEHHGSGPNKARQEKPHVHYSGFTPDEKYVVVVDLGIDQVVTYELINGELKESHSLEMKPGCGPRHIVFHPNKKYAYVMTELSSEVVVLKYNANDGSFESIQYISTLPEDFGEHNDGSAIHISSDGCFVYAANRGHNSIAVFEVDEESGHLAFIEHTSTEGDWPRDFALDPSEKFLLVSNQNSNNLVLFSRNESTGKLILIQSDVKVPDPVCVKFLNV